MVSRLNIQMTLVGFATLLVVMVGVLNVLERVAQRPVADDGVRWEKTKLGLRVGSVRQGSPAERAGVIPGDVLRGLVLPNRAEEGPIEISDDWQVQYYLDEEIGIGGNVTYIVERFNPLGVSKDLWEADLRDISPLPTNLWLDIYLALIGTIYLGIGLFVALKHEHRGLGGHFFAVCLFSFIYLFFNSSGQFEGFDKLVFLLDYSALVLLCPTFFHFCATFPHRSEWLDRHPWSLKVIYAPATALIALRISHLYLGKWSQFLLDLGPVLKKASMIHFTGFFIASAGIVIVTYAQATAPLLRQQIKWIVWGLTLGVLPWLVFYGIPLVLGIEPTPFTEAVAIGPTILVPLSFGYSIARYRLMDVDVIVRRSFSYALTTLSVVMIFMLGVVKAADWFREMFPTVSSGATTLLQVLVLSSGAILYAPLKNWLQERIDRIFYGARYDTRLRVDDFGRTMAATTALGELLNALANKLSETLSVSDLAIFITRPGESGKVVFVKAFVSGNLQDVEIPSEIASKLAMAGPRGYVVDERAIRGSFGLTYFFPCIARERMVAVIALGKTVNRTLLTSEDTDLLRGLAPYVAVAIENSLLYESEQERARELSQLKEFNENIIESINVGIVAVDLNGRITACNGAIEEMFGFSARQVEGLPFETVLESDLIRTIKEVTGGAWILEDVRNIYRSRTRGVDGQPLVVNVSISPLETRHSDVAGALVCIEDITSRVRLEEQLREADKLSSIGLLAAGVAHEVNTPLTGISSYTQMLLKQISEDDPKHGVLEKIRRQTVRASDIVNNLLNFSRTGNSVFSQLYIGKLLDDTLQLLEPQLNNTRIEVCRDYAHALTPVVGHAGKLQQVFMNLILNARDAMPNGGILTISAQEEEKNLIVRVSDTGMGISPENITKIYDPFFTTKEVGRGTGLGLAVSYGIIQEHAGHIFAESEPEKGTTFTIKLPTVAFEQLQAVGD
jgi:PAS domain S-box-containing protein